MVNRRVCVPQSGKDGSLRAAEAVDALLDVAHHKAVVRLCDRAENAILHRVDILVFVDVDGIVGVLHRVGKRRIAAVRICHEGESIACDVREVADAAALLFKACAALVFAQQTADFVCGVRRVAEACGHRAGVGGKPAAEKCFDVRLVVIAHRFDKGKLGVRVALRVIAAEAGERNLPDLVKCRCVAALQCVKHAQDARIVLAEDGVVGDGELFIRADDLEHIGIALLHAEKDIAHLTLDAGRQRSRPQQKRAFPAPGQRAPPRRAGKRRASRQA